MLRLWKWYQNCLATHPVKTQVISSGFIWGLGDIAAQAVTHSTAKPLKHVSNPSRCSFLKCFLFVVFMVWIVRFFPLFFECGLYFVCISRFDGMRCPRALASFWFPMLGFYASCGVSVFAWRLVWVEIWCFESLFLLFPLDVDVVISLVYSTQPLYVDLYYLSEQWMNGLNLWGFCFSFVCSFPIKS